MCRPDGGKTILIAPPPYRLLPSTLFDFYHGISHKMHLCQLMAQNRLIATVICRLTQRPILFWRGYVSTSQSAMMLCGRGLKAGLCISSPALRQAQARRAYVMLMFFLLIFRFVVISVIPIISTSTGPIFTKFAGLVELCRGWTIWSYFFRSPGDIAVKHAVNDTFVFSNTIISAWCAKHSSAAAVQKSTLHFP